MKGYKGTYNMKCRDFEFEVGKTYEIEGELEICKNGFHFCQDQMETLCFYEPCKDFVLLEIEALGEVFIRRNKSVTNKIKIVRVVPKEEWTFFKDNTITYKSDITNWEYVKILDDNLMMVSYESPKISITRTITDGTICYRSVSRGYTPRMSLSQFKFIKDSTGEVTYTYFDKNNRFLKQVIESNDQ